MTAAALSSARLLDGLDGGHARHDAAARGVESFHAAVAVYCAAVAALLRAHAGEPGELLTGADALAAVDELQRRAELELGEMSAPLRSGVLDGLASLAVTARGALFALGRVR